MSQENVELVREGIEAWNRRDFDGALRSIHPGVVIRTIPAVGSRIFRGHEEIKAFWTTFFDSFDELWQEPTEFIDGGDRVVVVVRWRGRGRDGIDLEQTIVDVYTFRNGLIVRLEGFDRKSAALEAAGLSE